MDGKPVWVKTLDPAWDGFGGWGMCRKGRVTVWDDLDVVSVIYRFEDYGDIWVAYSRPPEGDA